MTDEIDFDRVEAHAVRSEGERMIIGDWNRLNIELTQLRNQRNEVNERIRQLVAVRKDKAKLVRVIDPDLVKPSADGDE